MHVHIISLGENNAGGEGDGERNRMTNALDIGPKVIPIA